MELADTATVKSPTWAKFAVTSVGRDTNEWVRHCKGLVKVEVSPPLAKSEMNSKMDPRYPSHQAWYEKFTEIGLGYGKTFQPLSEIRADPYLNLAKATVALNSTAGSVKGGESKYPLHPAALDAAFQLAIIAFHGGQTEKANAAFVPVHLSKLYLKAGVQQDFGKVIAQGSIQGSRNAFAQLQMLDSSGNVFLEVSSMRFTLFKELKLTKDMQSGRPFSSPFTRLVWKPDIRTLNNRQIRELFPPPEENTDGAHAIEIIDMICCLIVFEIYDAFIQGGKGPKPKGDIRHWLAWIKKISEEDQRPNMVEARNLSPAQRRDMLQKLYDEAGDKPEAKAAKLLHESVGEILNEQRTGIDVLVSNKLLTSLYEVGHAIAGSHPQVYNIMDSLGHANPNLRILEIGAGTGAATRAAMKALVGPNGIKRYADYTFTDISAGFLAAAKEMLSDYRDVHYSVLDIEQNPLENGFEPVYDVVLACEAIHATASMDRTLKYCRSLLKPGGKLVLVETTRMRVLFGLLYGILTGYWQLDDRTEGPFMNLETWQRRLPENGLSGTDLVLDDYPAPHNTTSVLVTTRVEEENIQNGTRSAEGDVEVVYLLHDEKYPPLLLGQIATAFKYHGAACESVSLDAAPDAVPANARVVAFLSKEVDLFDADEGRLKTFQYLARNVKSMVWLVPGGIVKGQSPRGAFMTGLLRVIATENPTGRFLSINMENEDFSHCDDNLVRNIVDKELSLQSEELDEEIFDNEFVWQDGCLRVSRVVPDAGLNEYADTIKAPSSQGFQMLPVDDSGPVRAAFETAGVFHSLYFRSCTEMIQPLPDDYIDVKIVALGLNRNDVNRAIGQKSGLRDNFSSEYSGIVTKVGANVTGLSVGDHVFGLGKGYFGNYERVPAALAQKLRPIDDLVAMATMPCAFVSAVYCFQYIARVKKDDKVLIQSAASDVGLAAIQIARSLGGEVFVTASLSDEVSFLKDTVGFPDDHIFYSQEPDYISKAAKATGHQGFDVVLGSITEDDSIFHSIEAVAPLGHFINVSGVDVLEVSATRADPSQKSIKISSFDLDVVLDIDPKLGGSLMNTVNELYQSGKITPIQPVSVSEISELDHTLSNFSTGTNIGKLVVSCQNPNSTIKMLSQQQTAIFDPEARYIITGGFGGLGRSIIRWMVDHGAHDIVVFSRRGAETKLAQALIEDLNSRGAHIEAMTCDVSNRDQVFQAIQKISTSNRPVKGVVNSALSLSDLSFDKLNIDQWRSGVKAKTQGSVNLHEATIDLPLDFFVMLTSTETIWAPPTQAAYIAADNFAIYFARYRRSLGLPASTVSYGFVRDVGSDYRETSHGTEEMYARNLSATMTEYQALAALEPAFLNLEGSPHQWVGQQQDPLSAATFFTCLNPIDLAGMTSTNVPRWHRDGRVSLLLRAINDARRHALTSAEDGADGNADGSGSEIARLRRAFDDAINAGPESRATAVELVTDGIVKTIAEMLFIDVNNVNTSRTIAEHGVDSLIAAELRNWFHQALRMNFKNLLDSQTSIKMLAEQIVDSALGG